ncbi:MAG TPA: polyamine ABC transporter substrate-binding protein [Stellaceae bacterium]|jgi:putrescine transport system substrate-binding protein|nr:polyamine ABC transporter substrate-binding protein [Stellaceae bacterium]
MRNWPSVLRICLVVLTLAVRPLAAGAEEPRLHIYNWSDYIAPDTIANFEKETGIAVTYDVYDGNEVLEAKLLAGHSGYDIVVPSASPYMARQIVDGAYLALDKAKLPNFKNLDPRMLALAATADPGNAHGVPYLWSVTGIGFNTAMLDRVLGADAPRDSLALLFDPALAAKLARCGIELLDTPQEVIPAALAYLGIDPVSRNLGDLDRAIALIDHIRPFVRRFHSSQYINDLASGDICIALGYSGDVIQARNRAREAESPVDIAFRVPRQGAQMSIDMLGIPADAPHPDNAHRFLDYMLRPEVIAAVSNAVSYPNPNLAATALVSPDIRDDPGIYPPASVRRVLYVDQPAPRAYERARTRAWNRVKSGC